MNNINILVVGGGIAGLTAASALAQKGFAVDLIERKEELSDGGGVGLSVVANATRALAEIGAAEHCVKAGMGADSQAIFHEDGTLAIDMPLPRIGGPKWPATMGIRRSDLHESLIAAATNAGVQVRCRITVEEWSDDGAGVDILFSDGSKSRYSLMVGAEGISSPTRKHLMPGTEPEFANALVWRAEVPRPEGLDRTHVFVSGRQCVVGIVPLSEDTAYMYIGEDSNDDSYRDEQTLHHQMRDLLKGFGGMVADLAPNIDSPEKVNCRPVQLMLAPPPWHRGRVVIIGDAAHVHAPSIAQGAAMGIEDAIVLAEEVGSHPDEDIETALQAFNDRRYPRTKAVVEASTALAGATSEEELAQIRQDILKLLEKPI